MHRILGALIITQTPMRITLGGGGTDVLWYSRLKGGAWISAAINKYVYIFLNKTDDPNCLKIFDGNDYYIVESINNIKNPIVYESFKLVGIKKGVQVTTVSEVSGRSGLGGSGSFEVGLLNALYRFQNRKVSKLKLAEGATDFEIKKLRKAVGPQDQYIAALGGIKYFEIDRKGRVSVENLNLTKETLSTLQSNLCFFSTGIHRDAETILGDQKKKVQENTNTSKVIKALDEIKNLGIKVKEFLLKGQVDEFGKSLHEHWLIKKSLSDKVSNSKIDDWYNLALETGALGGKIMGAGGGGWFVFYVNKNKENFISRMSRSGLIPQSVNFDFEGTKLLT